MTLKLIYMFFLYYADALVINNSANQVQNDNKVISKENNLKIDVKYNKEDNAAQVFDGVYTECFLRLSYSCLQKKTLLYLKELDKLNEVSVIGDYVKFVKINDSEIDIMNPNTSGDSDELFTKIDEAVDVFFSNHILKFRAMGRDLAVPNSVDEFVGRKRKGGGGGGGGGHDHGGGDDGGKKKMMMMAMMCMKMKFMMMVPAMLGMMGMMSFKGMMFSMMSFMMAKMMLLMKILEKKGGGGGGGGGWSDGGGGWAAGGGGGAWMPAGGQDYGGGGGGGGYDANGQWQSRSIVDYSSEDPTHGFESVPNAESALYGPKYDFDSEIPLHGISGGVAAKDAIQEKEELELNKPIITYVKPIVSYSNKASGKKAVSTLKKLRDNAKKINDKSEDHPELKSRRKRGIVDLLQNAYLYWINKVLSLSSSNQYYPRYPKYKIVNGIKYVYFPIRQYVQNPKMPKDLKPASQNQMPINPSMVATATEDSLKPIVTAEDFNKGEIVEGPVESRMTKKLKDFTDTFNEAIEDNPWQ